MLRLAKYLKPYLWLILLSVVLLFVQANADLALPDYLSRIVNTGIQQGGVENAVPQAIRQSEMDRVLLFMSADDKTATLNDYTLVDQDSPDYERYLEQYPALADGPIYVLNDIDQAETERLNPIMGKALLVVYTLEQVIADPSKAAEMGSGLGFDPSKIPPGMDLFSVLGQLPADQRQQMSEMVNEQFAALGEQMVRQAAIPAVKAEYVALGLDTARMQNNYIFRVGGLMLLLTLFSVACTVAVSYLSARIAAGTARDMRRGVFETVENFSNAEFDKFSTASLITRTTNDITQIQMVIIMMVRMVFYAPIMGVGGIIRAMGKGSSMWWIIAVAVIVLVSLVVVVFSIALPKFKLIQQLLDRLNLVARENLSGMMVIRAFNMQEFEEKRFDKANEDLTAVSLFINRVMVVMMPLMMLIMNVLMLSVVWFGARQIADANMQVGDMIAFMQYAMQIVMAFLMLSMLFIILPRIGLG
jgi:ATP-binding cassette subfamily B protein